jgi:hypothetical protein
MGRTLEVLEDILVYGILLCILAYAYFTFFPRVDSIEGFATSKDIVNIQSLIQKELKEERQKTPTFFTQTSSAPQLPTNQSFLVNICPLTAEIGGYLGSTKRKTKGHHEQNGLMNADLYLETAFRAGIRSFILPISTYINASRTPPEWPYSGDPALVARNVSDTIITENGLTIDSFVASLLQHKSISGYGSEPIFLILEDAISDIDRKKIDYVLFMKKIAAALAPLDSYRLTSVGSYGSVVGGQKQNELLTQIPLSTFNNKIVIFTNFDVVQDPNLTLASYANFTYYDNTKEVRTVGMEELPGTTTDYVTQARINWYFARSKTPLVAPTVAAVQLALDNGLQCVPIPFISESMESVRDIWALWKGASYILKAEKARYTQPAPVVPAQVSTKLNASIQGQKPGNLVVNN